MPNVRWPLSGQARFAAVSEVSALSGHHVIKYLTLLVGCGVIAGDGDLLVHGEVLDAFDRAVPAIELWLTCEWVGNVAHRY